MEQWLQAHGLLEINLWTVTLRLLEAAICGGILGFDRMRKLRAAGLRTYALVCLGACTTMITGEYITGIMGSGDPTRIAAQVISGIGFIGAGTVIMTSYNRIRGLTTAAGLWACAALGLSIGAGMYVAALINLALMMVVMSLGHRFQNYTLSRGLRVHFYVIVDDEKNFADLISFIEAKEMKVKEIETHSIIGKTTGVSLTIDLPKDMDHKEAYKLLHDHVSLIFVEEM